MQWLNEPASWQRVGDVIKVDVDPDTDFWRETGYGYTRDTGHVYGEVLPGDLDVSVRMRANFTAANDQAGIMLRADEHTWLKTGLEVFDGRPRLSTVLTRGQSSWMMADLPTADEITLRVSRRGDAVEVRYAAGDGPSQLAALVYLPPDAEVLAGVMCAAPEGTGFGVTFRDLRIVRRDWADDPAEAPSAVAGEQWADEAIAGFDGDGEKGEPGEDAAGWDAGGEAGAGWDAGGEDAAGWDAGGEDAAGWDAGGEDAAGWDAGGKTSASWKISLGWDKDPEPGAGTAARAGDGPAGEQDSELPGDLDALPAAEPAPEDDGEGDRAPGTRAAADGPLAHAGGQGDGRVPAGSEGARHEPPATDGDRSGDAGTDGELSDPAEPDQKVTEAETGMPAVSGLTVPAPAPAPAAPGPSERPDPADEWISLLTGDLADE